MLILSKITIDIYVFVIWECYFHINVWLIQPYWYKRMPYPYITMDMIHCRYVCIETLVFTSICGIRATMEPSFILLINAYPAPLSVIVSPNASSVLTISISLGRPFLCANMKSSNPICPPRSFFISTLWVFSVQNRIWNQWNTVLAVAVIDKYYNNTNLINHAFLKCVTKSYL